ncbi:DDE superfamily endonuclease [Popillia japonica]|uniref:DDE superfamily endonuclease n=1 Tax=Popillia japonica TaxID=7064 RepID=A0AAW1M176_POPJA
MSNPFQLPNNHFIKSFRLSKEATQYLIDTIVPNLNVPARPTAIPNYLKVLCALYFLGHGSYQLNIGAGAIIGMSQPSVSRCVSRVCDIINDTMVNTWIQFPIDYGSIIRNKNLFFEKFGFPHILGAIDCSFPIDYGSIIRNKNLFFEKFGFPHILGAIDCSHIAIISPPFEHALYPAAAYYNRKGFYSINVHIIADASMNILNMNARYPGSVHDAAIWMMSNVNRHLRNEYLNGRLNCHLIGDEGYPLSPWLLVQHPGDYADNSPEAR